MVTRNRKFTDEQLMEALKAGLNNTECSRKFDCDRSAIRQRKRSLVAKGFSPAHDMKHLVPDGFKVKGVSSYYSTNPITGEEMLRGQWVKSSEDKERQLELLEQMCQGFIQDLPKLKAVEIACNELIYEDILAVYPLGDPHIGMLAWAEECGASWDLKIAEQVFCEAFDRVVRTAPHCKKALIINLGDFLHRDNAAGTTSRSGNILDCDGRYAKMVQVAVKIKRQMISTALQHHEQVEVWVLPGNHDDVGSLFLAIALKHIYENEPRVTINDNPSVFQYCQFGKVLIGAHHGHTCKMENLPGVMAADRFKEWGTSEFRYWLTGHIHHDSKKEFPGCMVESFRTLAAKDAYGTNGGWRAGQDTKCIVYHKEFGEIERHTVNIAQIYHDSNKNP